jgi:hypothetical protein
LRLGDPLEVGQGVGGALDGWIGWSEVFAFPDEAGLAGGIAVEEFAGGGATDVPVLDACVEPDVRGPEDFEPSERTEINRLSVEAVHAATGVNA